MTIDPAAEQALQGSLVRAIRVHRRLHRVQPLAFEILTPDEMAKADRLTIESGLVDGIGLMRRAGHAVAAVILQRFPDAAGVAVLAGPGNNGGDGYVSPKSCGVPAST